MGLMRRGEIMWGGVHKQKKVGYIFTEGLWDQLRPGDCSFSGTI